MPEEHTADNTAKERAAWVTQLSSASSLPVLKTKNYLSPEAGQAC